MAKNLDEKENWLYKLPMQLLLHLVVHPAQALNAVEVIRVKLRQALKNRCNLQTEP